MCTQATSIIKDDDNDIQDSTKIAAKSLPKLPWFIRPKALFSRELNKNQGLKRAAQYTQYLNNLAANELSRDNFYFVA